MQAEDTGGTGVSRPVPASRAVTRDQLHRQGPRAGAACTIDEVPAPRRSRKILAPPDHSHINQMRMASSGGLSGTC
jgi:hypothetical protein